MQTTIDQKEFEEQNSMFLPENSQFDYLVSLAESADIGEAIYKYRNPLFYWFIGHFINENLSQNNRLANGGKLLATMSKQLSWVGGMKTL